MNKRILAVAVSAIAIAVTAPFAFAQPSGYGHGMMGGYGGGTGSGMMGGYGGGTESGMMGGYGGGMGPGMMGGYGGGMGPGMMGGYGGDILGALDLTDDQREKITRIHEALSTRRWELMGKMQQQQFEMRGLLASGNADDAAIGKAYKSLENLRRQIWAAGADARKEIDSVLTKSQREQMQRSWDRNTK